MNRNTLTLEKMNEGTPEEQWHFHGTGNCGVLHFPSAIIIVEPLGICPGLCVNNKVRTHGIWGVEDAIKQFKAERAKLGLSTKR